MKTRRHHHLFLIAFVALFTHLHPTVLAAHPRRLIKLVDAHEIDALMDYLHVAEAEKDEATKKKQKDQRSDRDQAQIRSSPPAEVMARPPITFLPLKEAPAEDWEGIDLTSPIYLLDPRKHGRKSELSHKLKPDSEEDNKHNSKLCEDTEQRRQLAKKVRHFLHSQFQHIWSDHFGIEVLGMKVHVHSIRIQHIRMPKIHVESSCSSDSQSAPLSITVSGGSLFLLADYRSTYRTVRTGQLRVRLRDFEMAWTDRQTDQQKCADQQRIGQMLVRFDPRLLDEVDDAVRTHLRERVAHLLCARLEHFLRAELRIL